MRTITRVFMIVTLGFLSYGCQVPHSDITWEDALCIKYSTNDGRREAADKLASWLIKDLQSSDHCKARAAFLGLFAMGWEAIPSLLAHVEDMQFSGLALASLPDRRSATSVYDDEGKEITNYRPSVGLLSMYLIDSIRLGMLFHSLDTFNPGPDTRMIAKLSVLQKEQRNQAKQYRAWYESNGCRREYSTRPIGNWSWAMDADFVPLFIFLDETRHCRD